VTGITTTVTTVSFPFAGAGMPEGGSPAVPVDKTKLTGMQLQFTIAGGTSNACMVDLVVDDAEFY
jgi:hypothetical protein